MSESYYAFRFLLLFLIVAANGFFAGAEVALLTVRGSRLRQMAAEGDKGAQAALTLLANPERLLSVVQVGVTLCSLGLGWAGEDTLFQLFVTWLGPVAYLISPGILHGIAFVLSFLLMTLGHVVLGEVVPKNLAIEKADRIASSVAPALMVFYRVSGPLVSVIERLSLLVSRAIGLRGAGHGGGHSAEELKMIVSLSRGSGLLPEETEDMIHNLLDLQNLQVREVMVPRNEVVAVDVESTLEQVLYTMIREQHSRLPVYSGQPENVVGVLFHKDLLVVWAERRAAIAAGRRPTEFRLSNLMRKHIVVPETKPLSQMLAELRRGAHIALVVDEFGTIVGLVTLEDVLEQIVGEIEDEYDVRTFEPVLEEAPVLELDGTTNIRDLEMRYGIEIPVDAGFETLAGFLLQQMGEIPEPGDTIVYDNHRYTVLERNRNRIARVRIEKLQEESALPIEEE